MRPVRCGFDKYARHRTLVLLLVVVLRCAGSGAAQTYRVVDTGQSKCYDNQGEISPPKPGQPFYGQDSQFPLHTASYTPGVDGLTVRDEVIGLMWQRSPDTDGDGSLTRRDKLTLAQARELPQSSMRRNTEGLMTGGCPRSRSCIRCLTAGAPIRAGRWIWTPPG